MRGRLFTLEVTPESPVRETKVSAGWAELLSRLWEDPFQASLGCWHHQVPGRTEVPLPCSYRLGATLTS